MKTKFEKFIEKNYRGLNFITIPSEAYQPGVILTDDDRIFAHLSRIFQSDKKWIKKEIAANMANQTVSGERNLELGITVLGMVTLKGGYNSSYSVSFEFSEVSQVIFDYDNGGAYEFEVRTMIEKLKDSDKNTWLQLLHKFVAMEVVVVKSAIVEFKRNGKVLGDVDLPILENEVSINGSYQWAGAGKMEIKNEKNLPFGVLGFQIKRQM